MTKNININFTGFRCEGNVGDCVYVQDMDEFNLGNVQVIAWKVIFSNAERCCLQELLKASNFAFK